MKKLLTTTLLLALSHLAAAEIETTDGKRYEGSILSENDQEVVMTGESGNELHIPRANIAKVIYKDTTPKYKNQYWAFGATLGTPGVLNLNVWHLWETWGLQFSGGYWGTAGGAQLNAAWKIGEYATLVHCLFVGAGHSTITIKENNADKVNRWTYGIVGYNANWHGFFLEVGAMFGTGSYTNPQFGAQFGYMHRLNAAD